MKSETSQNSLEPKVDRLNWKAAGYFGFPLREEHDDAGLWRNFEEVLADAKAGKFAQTKRLLDLYDGCGSWILQGCYLDLLGDAGTKEAFQQVLRTVYPLSHPQYELDFCQALASWGCLCVVPTILETFERRRSFQDAEELPGYLSGLLEEEDGPIANGDDVSVEGYRSLVIGRYEELKAHFATDDVIVFRGTLFSVFSLADEILRSVKNNFLDYELRRKFEASTGINCTPFYQHEVLQPLAVAAVVEEFLESDWASTYEVGVRYFFGRPIPD